MMCFFLLYQISFCCKERKIKSKRNEELYEFHSRINDINNQIFLEKAVFSNFRNINFNGGAIYINKNKFNFALNNCQFDNCVGKNGGAIYHKSVDKLTQHSCSIYNALFTNCKAIKGGALYLTNGEAERNSISIEGCTFKFNTAIEKGGAIYGYSREKVAVQRCRFDDNEAFIKGSSLYFLVGDENSSIQQKLILYRDSFVFTANEKNLVNVYIESCNATKANANIFLGLCSFSSKNKTIASYKNLEVLENGKLKSFKLTECNCIQGTNETVNIQINSTENYSDLLIFECKDIDSCKSEIATEPLPNLTDKCDSYPNRQDYVGGSGVEFEKACFHNFQSPILQDGGAIHVINAQIDLETCTFINCSTDGKGGALYVILTFLDCEIEIEECLFENCSAAEDGGAVYVLVTENNNELEVDATTCQFCRSGGNGGAFYISFSGLNCNIEFEESIFESCVAKKNGGAIYFVSYKSSRSTFEEITFTNNSASNGGAYYYSPYSYSKLCRSDFFNNKCTGPNCSSNVYLKIDPNQQTEKLKRTLQNIDKFNSTNNEDDSDDSNEGDDEYDDAENNKIEDNADNLTRENVVLADNIFKSEPIRDSAQLIIEIKKKGNLLLGKNSFSFNGKDEKADKMNSNYIKVIKQNDTNISFKANGFICFAGNLTIEDFENNVQTNCPIVKEDPDKDGKYKIGNRNGQKRRKNILISVIVTVITACVATIIVIIALIIIPILKRKDIKQYSTNLSSGGDSIVSNINQTTNNEEVPQI